MRNFKSLITGGAGFIGSNLTDHLIKAGHKVTVLDNFMYKQNSLANCCSYKSFSVINGDVRNIDIVKDLIPKFDAFIPLAALVGAPICAKDPVGASTINHDSILELFKHISDSQYLLMPTTNSAYGSGDKDNYCNEDSPLNPISQYAKEKVIIEERLLEFTNAISFRLATVFGMSPRMRTDLLVNDFTSIFQN